MSFAPNGDLYFAGFALGQNLRAYRIHYNLSNGVRKAPQLKLGGNFRMGQISGITSDIPAGFPRNDLSAARFTISDAAGKVLFRTTPVLDGNKLHLGAFQSGFPGIFLCRLAWNSAGREQIIQGLFTVLP